MVKGIIQMKSWSFSFHYPKIIAARKYKKMGPSKQPKRPYVFITCKQIHEDKCHKFLFTELIWLSEKIGFTNFLDKILQKRH